MNTLQNLDIIERLELHIFNAKLLNYDIVERGCVIYMHKMHKDRLAKFLMIDTPEIISIGPNITQKLSSITG